MCVSHFFCHVCLFPIPLCICFLLFLVQPHYWPALFPMVVGGWSVAQLSHLSRIYFHRGRRFNHFGCPLFKKGWLTFKIILIWNWPIIVLFLVLCWSCVLGSISCIGVNFLYTHLYVRACGVSWVAIALCATFLQSCCVLGVNVEARLGWSAVRPFLYHFVCLFCFWTGWVGLPLDHSSRRKKKFPTSDRMLRWTGSGLDTLVEVWNTITGILNYLCIFSDLQASLCNPGPLFHPSKTWKPPSKGEIFRFLTATVHVTYNAL